MDGYIAYIGYIVHTGDIQPVKLIHETEKSQQGRVGVEIEVWVAKLIEKTICLTTHLRFLPVCAVILRLALCPKHKLEMSCLRSSSGKAQEHQAFQNPKMTKVTPTSQHDHKYK